MNKTRMGKRVASLLLSLVMMLSLLPTAAYAAMGDADETQGASVSENGTRVSDDSNSGGDTGDLQVGDSEDGGMADDTTGAEGGADTTGAEGGADTTGAEGGADPTDSVNGTTTYVAYIGEVGYETLDAAITAAGDGETVVVSEGEYTLNGSLTYTDKAITVKAADGAKVTFDMSKAVALHGAKITFENVTFTYTNADYTGLQHTDTVVYNNCTINGKMFLYANSETFNDCHFVQKSEDYNVWTYGAKKVAFNNCTFDCVGKAVNVYIEKGNASDDAKTIEVNGCTVNSDKAGKAFLNIKNSTQAYDVTLSGTNTVTGLANDGTTGSALYQVETTKVTETTGNPVTVKEAQTDGTVKTVYEVKQPSSSELTNYVTVSGIKGFDGTKFATFADAYAAIKPVVATLGLGQETPADAAAFDAVFTDISNGKATLTYTITGNVTYDETGLDHLLTMGRSSSHYLTNERHLINFKFVGAEADRGATLTVNSNITLPYEWWGEKITTSISFENLTITGSAPSGLFANQSFFEGIDFKVDNCTLKGIKIYNCANVGGSYTITNSKLDGTGAAKDAYAIHLQGNDTAPLNILIKDNQISGYDRGVNIDQKTAIATISGNSISIKDSGRSCIQLTQLAKTTVSGNTMTLTGGNAITLHGNLAEGSKIEVTGNTITGTGYLVYDAAKVTIDLTYTGNTVSDTIDTTKGVYGGKEYEVSENIANALKPDTTTYVAEVKGVKYDSLQAAIDKATEKATVILLADTRENVTISTNRLTLDLNGHTLNGGTVAGKPALTVRARNVIVKDSSEAQTGTIMREDTAENSGVSSHYVIDIQGKGAFLTFESGNVKNNSGNKKGNGASLVRVGDDSVSAWPQLTIAGGTFTQDNFIVIKVDRGTFYLTGGTLNSKNDYAVENWYTATIKGGTVNGTVAAWTYSGGHNSDLTISDNGIVNGDVASVSYGSAEGKVAKVSITGGTVTGTLGTYTYDSNSGNFVATTDATKATIAVTGGTFSKDPTKYVVEDSAISKNDDGTFGVAKAYLAKVGDTSYYTMDEAFKAQTASGKDIVMLRDYTTGSTFNSGSINRTVDLAGHTWTCTGTDANSAAFEINYANATLTVKNGKVISSQLVGLIPSAMGGTIKYDNSTLVFDGVEMTTTARSGIETNGNNTNDTVTLKNSTLNVPNGYGIYFPSSGTLTIDNSKINAGTMGVQVCSGSLNVTGADTAITVSGDGIEKTGNDGAIEDGAAISIVERTGYKGLSEIKVSGGTFTAKAGNDAVKAYKWENQTASAFDNSKNVVAVSGGTFSSAVDKSLCADGFIPTQNADGTYGVKEGKYVAEIGSQGYESLQAAIDAAKRNDTVTLLADTRENVTISTYGLTLDLNGHTLNGGTEKGKPALTVSNSSVTVKDSSEDKTGTIMREDTDSLDVKGSNSHYVIDIQGKNGFLKFESGNVKNTSGIPGVKGASLIRLGNDNVAGAYPTLTISGGTFTQDNFIAIKVDRGTLHLLGGTVNSANSFAIENWNNAYIKGGTVNGTVSTWVYSTGAAFSKLTISGGTVNGNVASVNYDNAADKQARVYVTGGTVTGTLGTYTYKNGLVAMDETAKATIEVTGGTFSKDPTQYVVEDSAITPNADGTFGVAKAYLAKVGETSYYTMDEAFHAAVASGETLTLLRDYTTGSSQNSGSKSFTIDLNGYTWTYTGKEVDCAAFEINYSDVTLTVKNGKVVSSQLVGLIPSAMSGTITYDNSGLVFEGVEMTANGHSGIETNGNNTNDTVTLKNSTLNVPNGYGIYFPSSGTLTIDNSKINAGTMGVQVCSGSLNVTGADTAITVSGDGIEKTGNDGAIEDGAAISIVERTGYKGLSEIKVSGGTFTAKAGNDAVKAYKWENQTASAFDNSKNVVAVSGGTFSSAVDKSLCADGFIPTRNEDGSYGVKVGKYVAEVGSTKYETLADAVAAAEDGQTVTLLCDVEQNTQLSINKSITLDLNGKTIRNTEAIWNDDGTSVAILSITNGANVTITGNGTIAAKENDCYTINVVNGDLTIENGTFVGNISVVQVQKGSLTINGGAFSLLQKMTDGKGENRYLINCIDSEFTSGNANVAISGGTFVGFDPNVSPEQEVDGKAPSFAAPGAGITKNEDGSFTAAAGMTAQILDKDGNSVKAYESLTEAVAAAEDGQTVTLLADATEDVVISKSITLDLGGKTLTNTNAGKATISVTSGTVTVKNGNVVGGTSYYNIEAKKDANLTLTDVTATAGNNGSSMIDNYGTLTITSGTYTGGLDTVKNEPSAKLNITGGTFTLTKGNSDGFTGVVFNYGELTISGGEFIQSDKSAPYGQAQVIHTDKSGSAAPSTVITGGTFKNLCTAKTTAWVVREMNAAAGATKVSGGAFNKEVKDYYCADGFIPTKNADGTYGVKVGKYVAEIGSKKYETLADAIRLAAKGRTITLLCDVEQNTQLSINKSITLDLNGKTIKISGYTAEKAQVSVKGNLTIQDSSEAQTGKICSDYTGTAGRVVSVENGGKLTIAGGTITTEGMSKSGSAVYIASGAEVNMTGGTVKVDAKRGNAAMNIRGSTGVFTMSGGSVIAEAGDGTETNITAISGISGSTIQISAGTVSGPQAVSARSSATTITGGNFTGSITVKNGSISGGTFDRALDKKACAAGYVPADNGDGTYGVAVGKFTVKVTSRTTGSDSPVANVAGGGSDITYAAGTTVTASAISGYNFVGWFVNEYTGTAYSTALTCEVKPTDDCTMIAVYEPISGGKFWLTVTASEFTVNGGAVQDSYLYEQFAVGASVTVNFTGSENFLYWVNASNKVVSTDKSYSFIMGSETTLKAVYGKARQNQATVVFISHSDQIISSKAYTTNDTIQFPVPPIKMGCTFTGWSMTEEQIRAAMANNSGIIQVRALYTEPSIACKVTVVYPEGTDNQVVNAVVGKAIDVTAKDIEGKTFSYWTDNDGNILGYTKTLKLAPSGDMTVKAVYGENAEVKPVISMTAIDASAGNGYYVISVTATRAVPEGYELVKQGILYSLDSRCAGDAGKDYLKLTADGKVPEGVFESIGNNNDLNGVTRFNGKVRTADTILYGRGYMILKNSAGEVMYVYADTILSGSYSSLNK